MKSRLSQAKIKWFFSSRVMTNLLFGLALFIILIVNMISYFQVQRFSYANQMIIHTYRVLESINSGFLNLVQVESAIRGFLITHDKQLLQEIDEKKSGIFKNIAQTKLLTKDNKSQQKRLTILEPLIHERIVLFDKTMAASSIAPDANTLRNLVTVGHELTKKIAIVINQMSVEEFELLQNRNSVSLNNLNKLHIIISITSILSAFLFILGIIIININLSQQERFLNEKRRSENLLRGVIEGTDEIIVVIDLQFQFTIFNSSFEHEFKLIYGKRPILGASLVDILSHLPEQQQKVIDLWKRALNGEEFNIVSQFGGDIQNTYDCSFNSIYNETGELVGAAAICRSIEKRIRAENFLKSTNEKLERTYKELKDHDTEMTLLNEMENALQTCNVINETFLIIKMYCQKLLPSTSGIIYLINPSRNYLESVTDWNLPHNLEKVFSPNQCWGLRQGKNYIYLNKNTSILCEHMHGNDTLPYICAPLLAQNEVIGMLQMLLTENTNLNEIEIKALFEKHESLLNNLTVQLALAIANIQLRDTLKTRAVRDSLTGLYNRMYLTEFLARDLELAHRNNIEVAVVMMDVDHFKKINDQYGHDAGDLILKQVGNILQNNIRGSDIACRYGGEEFLIIFYNTKTEGVIERIENIRTLFSQMDLKWHGTSIDKITASFGIAIFPKDGRNQQALITAADQALYQSKENGRNQFTIFNKNKT